MIADFRTLLRETEGFGENDRWFADIVIGDWFYFSAQAGPQHACQPRALLPPMDYTAFDLRLQTIHGVISYGCHGAWQELRARPWAARFATETPTVLRASEVPVATCQQIYADLLDYARTHPLP